MKRLPCSTDGCKRRRRSGGRYCKACHAAASRAFRAKQKAEREYYRKGDKVRLPDGAVAVCLGTGRGAPILKPKGKLL